MGVLVELLNIEFWEKNLVSPNRLRIERRSDTCSSSCTSYLQLAQDLRGLSVRVLMSDIHPPWLRFRAVSGFGTCAALNYR